MRCEIALDDWRVHYIGCPQGSCCNYCFFKHFSKVRLLEQPDLELKLQTDKIIQMLPYDIIGSIIEENDQRCTHNKRLTRKRAPQKTKTN